MKKLVMAEKSYVCDVTDAVLGHKPSTYLSIPLTLQQILRMDEKKITITHCLLNN